MPDPEQTPETPQTPAESAPEAPEKRRFDPLTHEEDMFKIVIWVAAAVLAVAVIVVIVEAV